MPNNQSPERFRTTWGSYASAAQLPNVAAASKQSRNLAVGDVAYVAGDGLYMCIDATRGAAIWVLIGGATGSVRAATPAVEGFGTGAFYEGATDIYRGDDNMICCALIYIQSPWHILGHAQRVCGTHAASTGGGWGIQVAAAADPGDDPTIEFVVGTSDGDVSIARTLGKPQQNSPTGMPGSTPEGRLLLIHGICQVSSPAGDMSLSLLLNGQKCGTTEVTAASSLLASALPFRIGIDSAAVPTLDAFGVLVLGTGIIANVAVDDTVIFDLQNHARKVMIERQMQDLESNGVLAGFDMWHSAAAFSSSFDGIAAPATWAAETGVGTLAIGDPLLVRDVPTIF